MEERVFAFVAGACLLLWLLARERRVPAGARRLMERAAFVGVGAALAVAVALSVLWFARGGP